MKKTLFIKFQITTFSLIVVFVFAIFASGARVLRAGIPEVPPNEYKITGREYVENGIVFDVPLESDPSRDATVVSFPNKAVIPSYINVGGITYTVRKIVKAPNTWLGDPDAWVTLPPTLKHGENFRRYYLYKPQYSYHPSYTYYDSVRTIGVTNINVTDLDSFLNMDAFEQVLGWWPWHLEFAYEDDIFKPKSWRLYVNGEQVHDLVYPEGSKINGVNLAYLEGINTITIPASDTVRTEDVDPMRLYGFTTYLIVPWDVKYKKIRFKGNTNYNLYHYKFPVDSIELPRGMTKLYGYGGGKVRVSQWPDNLLEIYNLSGYYITSINEIPSTVIKVGSVTIPLVNKIAFIPQRWKCLENVDLGSSSNGYSRVTIENCDEPLNISGVVDSYPGGDSPTVYIGRNLTFEDSKSALNVNLGGYSYNRTVTLILGSDVTEMPDRRPVELFYKENNKKNPVKPTILKCMGTTPPNFTTVSLDFLQWATETILVVPEGAEEAYRNHPVWKNFSVMLTHDGVDSVNGDKEIVSQQWYSLDGRRLSAPERGQINLCRITYSDGTTSTQKIAMPK